MNPLSTKRNKYFSNEKDNCIFTPKRLSYFIYDIIKKSDTYSSLKSKDTCQILDPSVGSGNLLEPFKLDKDLKNVFTIGFDIKDYENKKYIDKFIPTNFLKLLYVRNSKLEPDLIIMNPPFNNNASTKKFLKEKKLGKALLPDLFTKAIFKHWNKIPMISIQPMGFRLNQRIKSDRYKNYFNSENKISAIASLPLNIFDNVEFHVEVVFWNFKGLEGHYWYNEKFLNESYLDNYFNKGDNIVKLR